MSYTVFSSAAIWRYKPFSKLDFETWPFCT